MILQHFKSKDLSDNFVIYGLEFLQEKESKWLKQKFDKLTQFFPHCSYSSLKITKSNDDYQLELKIDSYQFHFRAKSCSKDIKQVYHKLEQEAQQKLKNWRRMRFNQPLFHPVFSQHGGLS